MPRSHPAAPRYLETGSGAERRVWQALQTLSDEAVVIAQYHVLGGSRVTREADLHLLAQVRRGLARVGPHIVTLRAQERGQCVRAGDGQPADDA